METKIINPITRTLDFNQGITIPCWSCKDTGKELHYTEICPVCKGKRKQIVNFRNKKCSNCEGKGYLSLIEPKIVGACRMCDGTLQIDVKSTNNMLIEDKLWYFENLFNFTETYTGKHNEFAEEYLGFHIVAGVTDYGRYLKMTEDEFRTEVKENFVNGFLQYCSATKNGKLPEKVLIRRGSNGWFAYPIYKQ